MSDFTSEFWSVYVAAITLLGIVACVLLLWLNLGTKVASGKDGIITLEFDDKDPKFAAEVANAYIDELRRLMTETPSGGSDHRGAARGARHLTGESQQRRGLAGAEESAQQDKAYLLVWERVGYHCDSLL